MTTTDWLLFIMLHVGGTGVGLLIAGAIFGCKLHPVKAFVIAAIGAAVYALFPFMIGGPVSFFVIVVLARQWGTGDWLEAFLTTSIARGIFLIVALFYATQQST